ncbi:MAG: sigma-54-dependent Fis family transcriptional regulator [Muribaculaceae bacterium]|nr:sigma-54-dependent Fis family transcriptional regulator [Muribaculaceae bacterium]
MQIDFTDIPPEVLQAKSRLGIVGNAPALNAAVSRAIQVAPIDLSVLINGESGTGKEFFPKIIHNFSSRKHNKYIAVNCGAIPEGTIDSELFGHEKGAFTGAISSRKGYFEEADGGTIFLDEVAELPMTTQSRLLRVLESGEFIKVGSSTVQKTNIRIVAATNVDMLRAVEEGKFREDLYYRLSTVLITIPPLRDRGNDILLLARKFAADFVEKYRTPAISLDDSARRLLLHYRWPGNVRQLKNIIEQISLFEAGSLVDDVALESYIPRNATIYAPTVTTQHSHSYEKERELLFNMIFRLQHEIEELKASIIGNEEIEESKPLQIEDAPRSLVKFHPKVTDVVGTPVERQIYSEVSDANPESSMTLEDTERETIRRSLERNGGRRKATAQELNISERTLYRKIKEYGLE